MIPFLALVWAEVAGKREKWKRRLERERGRTGSINFSDEWGRFPAKQMAVEGWQGGGEYFGGKIGPWGGRKRLERRRRRGARREKLAGVIPARTGSFRRRRSKTRVAGVGGYLFRCRTA